LCAKIAFYRFANIAVAYQVDLISRRLRMF
jgi:hypothetical protein